MTGSRKYPPARAITRIENLYENPELPEKQIKPPSKQQGVFDLLGHCSLFDVVIPFSNR